MARRRRQHLASIAPAEPESRTAVLEFGLAAIQIRCGAADVGGGGALSKRNRWVEFTVWSSATQTMPKPRNMPQAG
jgi:hypothetical protein